MLEDTETRHFVRIQHKNLELQNGFTPKKQVPYAFTDEGELVEDYCNHCVKFYDNDDDYDKY